MGKDKISTIPFSGTLEQEKRLLDMLDEIKGTKGALMPALQRAQDIYGYLPLQVQQSIADRLEISLEEVFGVVTFYSQFSLNPKGKYKVGVCMGTACYVRGSGEIMDKFKELLKLDSGECSADGRFSLDATRCIGCCGLAPVLTVNDDVYGKITSKDVAGIIAKYKD